MMRQAFAPALQGERGNDVCIQADFSLVCLVQRGMCTYSNHDG